MDALHRLVAVAGGLLGQIDRALLRQGAPENHPVWRLLREVGALPGEAVEALAGWQADAWWELRAGLKVERDRYEQVLELLHRPVTWEGLSGGAAAAQLTALSRATEQAAERLDRTDLHLREREQWLSDSRDAVARALARAMSSIEAVALVTGVNGGEQDVTVTARNAADLGVVLLTALADCRHRADLLERRWAGEFAELAVPLTTRAVDVDLTSTPTALRIDL